MTPISRVLSPLASCFWNTDAWPPKAPSTKSSAVFSGTLDDQRDRPVVAEGNGHVRLEHSGRHGDSRLPHRLDEMLIEAPRLLSPGRPIKAGTPALAAVAV